MSKLYRLAVEKNPPIGSMKSCGRNLSKTCPFAVEDKIRPWTKCGPFYTVYFVYIKILLLHCSHYFFLITKGLTIRWDIHLQCYEGQSSWELGILAVMNFRISSGVVGQKSWGHEDANFRQMRGCILNSL